MGFRDKIIWVTVKKWTYKQRIIRLKLETIGAHLNEDKLYKERKFQSAMKWQNVQNQFLFP